jgi:hypothetical protein
MSVGTSRTVLAVRVGRQGCAEVPRVRTFDRHGPATQRSRIRRGKGEVG